MKPPVTPFRARFERSRTLPLEQQLRECADYLQNPEVLLLEFLEAYYVVEREFDPDAQLKPEPPEDELVLEPFCEHLELQILHASGDVERITCASGSINPLPGDADGQPQGIDYVGLRPGEISNVVLGVIEAAGEDSPYLLLMRAMNGLAELAAPFQVAKLGRELLGRSVDPSAAFDLQIAIAEGDACPERTTLLELTRDLAEVFKRDLAANPQFTDAVDRVECLSFDPTSAEIARALQMRWSV